MFLVLLGMYLGIELLGHRVTMFNTFGTCQSLPNQLYHFIFLLAVYEGSNFATSLLAFGIIPL